MLSSLVLRLKLLATVLALRLLDVVATRCFWGQLHWKDRQHDLYCQAMRSDPATGLWFLEGHLRRREYWTMRKR